jgi:hypothetical protein
MTRLLILILLLGILFIIYWYHDKLLGKKSIMDADLHTNINTNINNNQIEKIKFSKKNRPVNNKRNKINKINKVNFIDNETEDEIYNPDMFDEITFGSRDTDSSSNKSFIFGKIEDSESESDIESEYSKESDSDNYELESRNSNFTLSEFN